MRFNRVWDVSMPRTGTRSVAEATIRLGLTATHGCTTKTLLDDWWYRSMIGEWEKARIVSLYDYLGQLAAPWAESIYQLCPDDGFILCVRDEDDWSQSVKRRYEQYNGIGILRRALQGLGSYTIRVSMRAMYFGGTFYSDELWRRKYREHNERIQERMADRLLVMNLFEGDGFEKLSNWLDVPNTATGPFPKIRIRVPKSLKNPKKKTDTHSSSS
jgi:hypothetical protein